MQEEQFSLFFFLETTSPLFLGVCIWCLIWIPSGCVYTGMLPINVIQEGRCEKRSVDFSVGSVEIFGELV